MGSSGGLSKDQIENMVKEGEKFKEADEAKRDLIEEKNRVESMVHETEKQLENFSDQLSSDKKEAIKTEVQELREAMNSEDITADALRENGNHFKITLWKCSVKLIRKTSVIPMHRRILLRRKQKIRRKKIRTKLTTICTHSLFALKL